MAESEIPSSGSEATLELSKNNMSDDGTFVPKVDAVPELAASSSSSDNMAEDSVLTYTAKECPPTVKLPTWTEKMSSQCNMETACGDLQIEVVIPTPVAPRGNEGVPFDEGVALNEPWTKEACDSATDTWASVSTKALGLIENLRSIDGISEKAQDLKTAVKATAQSFHDSCMSSSTAEYVHNFVVSTLDKLTADVEKRTAEGINQTFSIMTEREQLSTTTEAATTDAVLTPGQGKIPAWSSVWTKVEKLTLIFRRQVESLIIKYKHPESNLLEDLKVKFSFLQSACIQMDKKLEKAMGIVNEEDGECEIGIKPKEVPTANEETSVPEPVRSTSYDKTLHSV